MLTKGVNLVVISVSKLINLEIAKLIPSFPGKHDPSLTSFKVFSLSAYQ